MTTNDFYRTSEILDSATDAIDEWYEEEFCGETDGED